jgi:hypothetical protein
MEVTFDEKDNNRGGWHCSGSDHGYFTNDVGRRAKVAQKQYFSDDLIPEPIEGKCWTCKRFIKGNVEELLPRGKFRRVRQIRTENEAFFLKSCFRHFPSECYTPRKIV